MAQPSCLHHQSSNAQNHAHDHGVHHHDEAGLADLLQLDAELLAPLRDGLGSWAAQHPPVPARSIVDLGVGPGTASLALAQRFPGAEVVAVDRSSVMLYRLREAAIARGLADRLRAVQCDL